MKWFLTGLASSFNYWKNLRSYFSFSLIILMDYFSIPQNSSIAKYLRLVKTQDLLQICLYSFTELSWGRMVCIFVCLFAFLELFSFTSIFIVQVACLDYSRLSRGFLYGEFWLHVWEISYVPEQYRVYMHKYCLINVIVKDIAYLVKYIGFIVISWH